MSEPRSGGGIGKVLALLAPGASLVGLDSLITVPLIPDIVRDTAVLSDLGVLLVSAYALAYAVGGFAYVGILSATSSLLVLPLVVYLVKEQAADTPSAKAAPGTVPG